jgi:hypothetical protein
VAHRRQSAPPARSVTATTAQEALLRQSSEGGQQLLVDEVDLGCAWGRLEPGHPRGVFLPGRDVDEGVDGRPCAFGSRRRLLGPEPAEQGRPRAVSSPTARPSPIIAPHGPRLFGAPPPIAFAPARCIRYPATGSLRATAIRSVMPRVTGTRGGRRTSALAVQEDCMGRRLIARFGYEKLGGQMAPGRTSMRVAGVEGP